MPWEISKQENTAALVNAVARQWVDWIRSRPSDRLASVALGGGRVFRAFLKSVQQQLQPDPTGLDRLEFFWGDERCVGPEDPESNYRLGHESFLAPLSVSPERIHRLRGEAVPAEAAKAAEVILRTALGCGPRDMPSLDLIFLGMGEDGHVASLFPGAAADVTESSAIFLPVIGPKPPPQRLTLSHKMIAAAREVWVIASGAGKEKALRESLRPNGTTPLARVLRDRPSTRIFSDIQFIP